MRQALRSSISQERGSQSSQLIEVKPALKGLTSEQGSRMNQDPMYATILTNLWVNRGRIETRPGSLTFANRGGAGSALGMGVYTPPNTGVFAAKLFSLSSNGIYDVTAGGAYGAAGSVLTGGFPSATMISNSAGTNFLFVSNGVDQPRYWTGAAWTLAVITGTAAANATDLAASWIFKRRLFFAGYLTGNAYYLPVDSIQGAAKKFPVGPLFSRGGYLMCGFTWSLDSGTGPDDYCCFLSSEGELAIYAGTDPASAASFGLVGVYYIGRPTSPRCWVKVGGDVFVMTTLGLFSVAAISKAREATPKTAISSEIASSWQTDFNIAVNTWVTSIVYLPLQNVVICGNANTGNNYVYNLLNGTWSVFDTWDMRNPAVFNNELYSAYPNVTGDVIKMWTGLTDWVQGLGNNQSITSTYSQVPFPLKTDMIVQMCKPYFFEVGSTPITVFNGTILRANINTTEFPWVMPPNGQVMDVRHNNFTVGWSALTSTTGQQYDGCHLSISRMAML